jgi:hypothetical protein
MHHSIRLAAFIIAIGLPASASLQTYSPALPLAISPETEPVLAEDGLVSTLFDCQPRLFNPAGKLTPNTDGTYKVPGLDGAWMEVKTITMKKPYSMKEYQFACNPNIFSSALEIKRDGKRFALYTHVVRSALSPDQRYLYLDNYIEQTNGQWKRRHRIIDLISKTVVSLPHAQCTLSHAAWSQGRLITHSSTVWGDEQTYCVWSAQGKVLSMLRGNLLQSANDERVIAPYGLLPKEPDTFWAIHTNWETERCTLILQQLKGQKKQRSLDLGALVNDLGACSWDTIEIDMTKATFAKSPVRFRTRPNSFTPWSSWK